MAERILVTRSAMPSLEEYVEEIRPLWDSHWITNNGALHEKFEAGLTEYLGVKELSLLTNGHLALELTLQAMKLHGEVITTPFTFASTTHAIIRNNLEPVFCDVNEDDYTMDVTKIEGLITDRTTAILPVHVYGNVCGMEEIERIARKYELKVVYDAAHTFGVRYKGKSVATFGDASILSFHATKLFNTIEGGAVCFENKELGSTLYKLKNFGIKNEVTVDGVGANAKMSEFQAAMGICNLRHVQEEMDKRKRVSEQYRSRFKDVKGIRCKTLQQNVESNYAYFPILIDESQFGATRNEVYTRLREDNIFARKYFYPLTNTFECFHGKYDVGNTPVALYVSKRILALPIYGGLGLDDVERICEIILSLQGQQ